MNLLTSFIIKIGPLYELALLFRQCVYCHYKKSVIIHTILRRLFAARNILLPIGHNGMTQYRIFPIGLDPTRSF
jgi:hypothetical protein